MKKTAAEEKMELVDSFFNPLPPSLSKLRVSHANSKVLDINGRRHYVCSFRCIDSDLILKFSFALSSFSIFVSISKSEEDYICLDDYLAFIGKKDYVAELDQRMDESDPDYLNRVMPLIFQIVETNWELYITGQKWEKIPTDWSDVPGK